LDHRSDIYSLGALLFHIVTLRYPVEGADRESVANAHRHGERIDLADVRPQVPRWFRDVVERCLDPNPGQRFQSADDVAAALEQNIGTRARRAQGPASHAVLIASGVLVGAAVTWFATRDRAVVTEVRGTDDAAFHVVAAPKARVATITGHAEALAYVGGTLWLRIEGTSDPCLPVEAHRSPGNPESIVSANIVCQDRIAPGESRVYKAVAPNRMASARGIIMKVEIR
jgi:hypothetical protein